MLIAYIYCAVNHFLIGFSIIGGTIVEEIHVTWVASVELAMACRLRSSTTTKLLEYALAIVIHKEGSVDSTRSMISCYVREIPYGIEVILIFETTLKALYSVSYDDHITTPKPDRGKGKVTHADESPPKLIKASTKVHPDPDAPILVPYEIHGKMKHQELEPEVRIPGLECNISLPEGVSFVNNLVIEHPENRLFFIDIFGDAAFQRMNGIHKVLVLVLSRNQGFNNDDALGFISLDMMCSCDEGCYYRLPKLRPLVDAFAGMAVKLAFMAWLISLPSWHGCDSLPSWHGCDCLPSWHGCGSFPSWHGYGSLPS
ncbi:hypothetical protein Tco_0781847 [Tanacetum coccineum]